MAYACAHSSVLPHGWQEWPCALRAAKMHALHAKISPIESFTAMKASIRHISVVVPTPGQIMRVAARAAASPSITAPPEEEAAFIESSLTLSDLWNLLKPDWRLIAACAAATSVSVTTSVLVAPCLGRVIDVISAASSTNNQLATSVGALGAVYIISNISLAAQVALSLSVGEAMASRLRARLFRSLLGRDAVFHDTIKTGAMTAWLGQDIETLQTTVAKLLGARGLRAVLETVGIMIVLTWLSWPLAVALMLAVPLVGPVVAAASRGIKGAAQECQALGSDTSAAADEIVENIRIVRAYGAEDRQLGRFYALVNAAHAAARRVVALQAVLDVSGRVRNTLCVLISLSLGSHLALANRVSIGVCYSFFIYSFSFAFALSNLTATIGDLSKAAGTMGRMLHVLRRCEDQQAEKKNLAGATLPVLRGQVEFRGVSYRHPGGWEMRDVNLFVPAGKTLALVGPSGGGKSTIAALLLGIYTPDSGEILIDGVPLHTLDMTWWRRQIGVVDQDPGLLNGHIRDLVMYGSNRIRTGAPPDTAIASTATSTASSPSSDDVSDAYYERAVVEALRDAQALHFVRALPAGLGTYVGPGGVELSGGQQQRLALARALMGDPKILVLDEATSALDVGTEAAITEALVRERESGCRPTAVVIAHRLSTVRAAGTIAVVSNGSVVEQGSPAELASKKVGLYASMLATDLKSLTSGSTPWSKGHGADGWELREEEGDVVQVEASAVL